MTLLINNPSILIIDDTPSNLSVVVNLFESKGYRVAIAQDGEEGWQRAQLVQPDLILLDVMMPGMDGFETCKKLKAEPSTRGIPVIIMTALATIEHKVKGFDSGAVDYITKPLQIDEVMARVETHLNLYFAQNRLAEQNAQLEKNREELEQRVAERTAELVARECAFRTLAENLPDNLARYDNQCRVLYMNPSLSSLLGMNADAVRETPLPDKLSKEYRACLEETISTGNPGELELILPDQGKGERYHYIRIIAERDADGRVVGALAIGRDITDQKNAERELLLLNCALDNSFDATYLLGEDMRFRYVNEAAVLELGYSRQELLGMSLLDIDPNLDRNMMQTFMRQTAESGRFPGTVESIHKRKNNETFPVEIGATFMNHNDERLYLTVVRNITERKQAENLLHEQEQAIRAVVEHSPDAYIRYDRQLRRLYINPVAQALYGIPTADVIGKTLEELPAATEELAAAMTTVFESGKELRIELPFSWPNGEKGWSDVRIVPEFGKDGQVVSILSIGRDITERKLAEDAIRKSDQRYHLVFENSPISIWEEDFSAVKEFFDELRAEGVTDIDTHFEQYPETIRKCATLARIVDVNQAAVDLHEAKNKEALFDGLFNTFTPESFEAFRQELSGLWKGKTRMTLDAVVKTHKGKLRSVTVHFSVCPGYETNYSKVLVSIVDITDRKLAEEALFIREREFRTLAENIPDHIIRYDWNGKKKYLNTAAASLLGGKADELLMLPPEESVDRIHAMQVGDITRRLESVLETGEPQEFEATLWHAVQGMQIHNMRFVPERDEDGSIVGALLVGHDITKLKLIESELKLSREQLRGLTARREEVREQERRYIAREVHDELGQILTGLKLNVSLLKHQFGNDSPALSECLKETSILTDRSLEVARNVASALRPAALDMGIASALEWLVGRFESNTGIRCSIQVDDGEYDLAENCAIALFRITQESLTNIARHAQATHIVIGLSIGPDDYTLKVRDNGLGFDTSCRKANSFGLLGMHERVIMLDGEFTVESQPGKGTLVMVRIPHMKIEGEI